MISLISSSDILSMASGIGILAGTGLIITFLIRRPIVISATFIKLGSMASAAKYSSISWHGAKMKAAENR